MTNPPTSTNRIDSIDLLRGFVMVIMALDHVRDFVSPGLAPETIPGVEGPLFLTRLVTHICAPVFALLAGVGAFYYYRSRGNSRAAVSRFLISRGIWLIVLEFTIVAATWTFKLPFTPFAGASAFIMLLVLWALGVSMIVLGVLVWLPRVAILAMTLPVLLGHDFLHFLEVEQRLLASTGFVPVTGTWDQLWAILHVTNKPLAIGNIFVFTVYPLIPWIALLAFGYAITPKLLEEGSRTRRCLAAGLGLIAAFVALRYLWPGLDRLSPYEGNGWIDFLNTSKYPPSLPYLMMTIGPALVLIAFFETVRGKVTDWLLVFGRVPLFFFVIHAILAHVLGMLWVRIQCGVWFTDIRMPPTLDNPPGLVAVYALWIIVVAALYVPCRWFMNLRRRRRDLTWLTYL